MLVKASCSCLLLPRVLGTSCFFYAPDSAFLLQMVFSSICETDSKGKPLGGRRLLGAWPGPSFRAAEEWEDVDSLPPSPDSSPWLC